ncbi:glycerate kinase-like [Ptychodera flava]|uniref:glycerate kinase-like n=1 Tax=Ptychodera flava TaxID=63121 RepID=UPI003969DFCE
MVVMIARIFAELRVSLISNKCNLLRESLSPLRRSRKMSSEAKPCPEIDAVGIFDAGVEAVLPHQMVKNTLVVRDNELVVEDRSYSLHHNVHVVAFGKAVIGMVRATNDIIGEHLVSCIASVPLGMKAALTKANKLDLIPKETSTLKLIEGAPNNLPDEAACRAARDIENLALKLTADDLLIVLMSGGGSALLPSPAPSITLEEKYKVSKVLAAKGATINQLNTVRKNISTLKGGGLVKAAIPAKVISLILSDIIGDYMGLIASGPTVPNDSTARDCIDIIEHLHAADELPQSVMNFLHTQAIKSSSKQRGHCDFSHVQNVIVGSNSVAVKAAVSEAGKRGYLSTVLSTVIDGEARDIGDVFARVASLIYHAFEGDDSKVADIAASLSGKLSSDVMQVADFARKYASDKKPICVIGAGETTVTVSGSGKGGRNQELALATSLAMNKMPVYEDMISKGYKVIFLSAGTDGQDGPTDAAGAFAYPGLVTRALEAGLDANQYLHNNDSYNFYSEFDEGKSLIITGLTGTNVMDLQVLLVVPPV